MTSNSDLFTCVTCNVAFNDAELQRAHYKIDWHRYNLKRRVADLPPVSLKDFNERVVIQTSQQKENEEMFCKLCSKHYTTNNAFLNHKQSKKHKELEAMNEMLLSEQKKEDNQIAIKSDRTEKKAAQFKKIMEQREGFINEVLKSETKKESTTHMEDDGNDEWEDIIEDEVVDSEEDPFDKLTGIDIKKCFFCDHESETVEDKCEHMTAVHSFQIPDIENVNDLEGLVKFLGIKLGAYYVCLWCSGKCYNDLESVRKHMSDKGHQKMKFEGETLLEYADYYAYDLSDSESDYDMLNESDLTVTGQRLMSYTDSNASFNYTNNNSSFDDETFQLVLPSGATIGHRSLFRYYKQSFGHRSMELKARNNITLKDKYKMIASNSLCYTRK
jgi:pre-60S factor REI1